MIDVSDTNRNLKVEATEIYRDGRSYWPELATPHEIKVVKLAGGNYALLILRQTRDDGDVACSVKALEYFDDAFRDGLLKQGYAGVVGANDSKQLLRHIDIRQVLKNVANSTPRAGRWGDYFWLDQEFKPVGGGRNEQDPLRF